MVYRGPVSGGFRGGCALGDLDHQQCPANRSAPGCRGDEARHPALITLLLWKLSDLDEVWLTKKIIEKRVAAASRSDAGQVRLALVGHVVMLLAADRPHLVRLGRLPFQATRLRQRAGDAGGAWSRWKRSVSERRQPPRSSAN